MVADKLAEIAYTFHSIISMLTSLGGLSIPQIAAGSVVPVKTRVSGPDGYADYPGVRETDFEEYMERNADILREILEAIKRQKLNIDINALAKAVYYANRNQDRLYGRL